MSVGDTLEAVSEFFAAALTPLAGATNSEESAVTLIESIGWVDLPLVPDALLDLQLAMRGLLDARADLIEARVSFSAGSGDADAIATALTAVAAQLTLLVSDIRRLPDAFRAELPTAYLTETGIADQVEKRLFDALVYTATEELFPGLRRILSVIGILEQEPHAAAAAQHQPEFVLLKVNWGRFSTVLQGPEAILQEVYGWGTPTLNTEKLFSVLFDLSIGFLSAAEIRTPSETFLNAIAPGGVIDSTQGPEPMLVVPLASVGGLGLNLGVLAAPKQTETEIQGLGFHLVGAAASGLSLEIGQDLFFELQADADLTAGVGAIVRPNEGISVVTNPDQNPVAFAGGKLDVRIARRSASDEDPIGLVTVPGGAFIDAEELFVRTGVEARSSPFDLFIETGVVGGRFVIPSDGSDSFTRRVLPPAGLVARFDLGLGWSQRRGVYLTGSAGLETLITIGATLGPFHLDFVRLRVSLDGEGLTFAAGVVGGATLGPFTVTVDAIGIQGDLRLVPGGLGPIDLALGLSVPRGYGIAIDAGVVKGGGFLYFGDGRYSGVLELSICGISVKAFGLIETVLPDGSDGFSFVIVIIAEFTPIQLGFGFTLVGVGGLLGVNRTVDERALGEAVRTGSLAHLLFPVNVVQNAPAIINDLAAVFPATRDHHLFGPMAKLGWGTPTLITADIGVIIEFPGPRLALLGVVRMLLPSADFAILRLNAAIGGVLDFPAGRFEINASLFDSFVAGYVVSGDMAFRMQLGDRPSFLLSIGGFNSGFRAPAGFPSLRRASADLGVNGNPSLTATGYFALTSNSAQFGASIQLRASGYGIRLTGGYGFDVLFVFSPFRFTASIHAGMRVSFHGFGLGVTLHGSMSGPTPWHFNGRVCVEVAIWDACLPIDVTFGREQPAALPELDPWRGNEDPNVDPRVQVIGLGTAVSDPRNWEGEQPPDSYSVVSLAQAATTGRTPIDPVGPAVLRQKVCPLGQELEKFGEYVPIVNTRFDVSSVTLGGEPVEKEFVEDAFARGQFENLSNAEKLSADSYDEMISGIRLAPDRVRAGTAGTKTLEYETVFVTAAGERVPEETTDPKFVLTRDQLVGMLQRSAAGRGGVRRSGVQKYMLTGRPKLITLDAPTFIVVDACTHVWNTDITPIEVSQTAARLKLKEHLKTNPGDAGRFAVVPFYAKAA